MSAPSSSVSGVTLHLLSSSAVNTLESCLRAMQAGDSLVLINTAVLHLLEPEWVQQAALGSLADGSIYVPEADLEAHGLAHVELPGGIRVIDDVAWAGQVKSHAHCLSWK